MLEVSICSDNHNLQVLSRHQGETITVAITHKEHGKKRYEQRLVPNRLRNIKEQEVFTLLM